MLLIKEIKDFVFKLVFLIIPFSYKFLKNRKFEWDLSGPFLMIILLCFAMTKSNEGDDRYFVVSFIVLFLGAFLSYIHIYLFKRNISFIEILNVFCLCTVPIFVIDLIIFGLAIESKGIKIMICILGFIWCCYSMMNYMLSICDSK
jgi:hypothetical protein